METNETIIKSLKVYNLKENATISDMRTAYLERTSQNKFQKVFFGDEQIEKEFLKYYEAYMVYLKNYEDEREDLSNYSSDMVFKFTLNQGLYYMIRQQYMKAFEKFQEAFKLKNTNVTLLVYLSIILIKRKNYYAAEKYLNQATELDKNNDDAWFYLGETYVETGNLKKALKMFETCRVLNPLRSEVAAKLKDIKVRLGIEAPTQSPREKRSFLNWFLKKFDKTKTSDKA
jgi:tetratricopeptide (TPR) repeat protein